MTVEFFVYALIDPRDNVVFYIGETSDRALRARQHRNDALRSKPDSNAGKATRIQEIYHAGLAPLMKTVSTHRTKMSAYLFEQALIQLLCIYPFHAGSLFPPTAKVRVAELVNKSRYYQDVFGPEPEWRKTYGVVLGLPPRDEQWIDVVRPLTR